MRVANRTPARAHALAAHFAGVEVLNLHELEAGMRGVSAIINATSAGLEGDGAVGLPWASVPPGAVVMDMVYKPLCTPLLRQARSAGFATVDGLAMLVGQAVPSFEALFGQPVSRHVDVRALALAALGEDES